MYTATLSLKDNKNYSWSDGTNTNKTVNWEITKANNTLKVKSKNTTVNYEKLKKEKLDITRVLNFVSVGQGPLSYAKRSGNKKIIINKRTGNITVKRASRKKAIG